VPRSSRELLGETELGFGEYGTRLLFESDLVCLGKQRDFCAINTNVAEFPPSEIVTEHIRSIFLSSTWRKRNIHDRGLPR
jgi:hypothetical protein